ncbi:NADH-quinone oxidoreductase subunit L [Candidatus Sumerlaeota bacterium]|nr:NADH-quinone oxidoreductase subunit L [Candidatus Sumerlaeota bacterium]
MIDLVWLIPVIMAGAALANGLGCRKLGKIAGYISVGAMITTFVISCMVFLQVRDITKAIPHHGGEHAAEQEAHHGRHGASMLAEYETLGHEQQEAIKAQYLFVRADPKAPKPYDTTVRGGLGGHVPLYEWINIPGVFRGDRPLTIEFAFHVDQLTSIFLMFISFVGSLVFIYATGYMKEGPHNTLDPGYARFFSYLALFAASMYTLILGANFVVMFIGWEGVGLCSYLLIGYYFDRQFSAKLSCADAGKKAFVANRVGDFGLMLGMFLLFWGLGTLDFQTIITMLSGDVSALPAGFGYNGAIITAATLLLFLGATGKSAQIPLFVWLPDAMAGPTPVSALIHAATMVTAGIYMLARLNVLYMLAPTTLVVVAVIGGATAFIAAFAGLTQRGIKKILAYSTVSQLGYMFLAMGVGSFAAGIFHVFTHAFFKACLFLAAGSLIHALHHEEDVFKMGGLAKKMKGTAFAYGFATLAIAGIVPFAGFFSKDEILYNVYTAAQGSNGGFYCALWLLGLLTALLTAFYMGRSFVLAFLGKTRLQEHPAHDAHQAEGEDAHDDHHHHAVAYSEVHESPLPIVGPIVILGILSLVVGWLNIPEGLLPLGDFNSLFHHFLAPVTDRGALLVAAQQYGYTGGAAPAGAIVVGEVLSNNALATNWHGPELILAIVSVAIGLVGLGFAFMLYGSGSLAKSECLARKPLLRNLWNISFSAWKWDDVYDAIFVRMMMTIYAIALWFDQNIVDGVVNGIGLLNRRIGIEFRRLQNGQVQVYGLVMFVGVCVVLLYFVLSLPQALGENRMTVTERTREILGSKNVSSITTKPVALPEQPPTTLAKH